MAVCGNYCVRLAPWFCLPISPHFAGRLPAAAGMASLAAALFYIHRSSSSLPRPENYFVRLSLCRLVFIPSLLEDIASTACWLKAA